MWSMSPGKKILPFSSSHVARAHCPGGPTIGPITNKCNNFFDGILYFKTSKTPPFPGVMLSSSKPKSFMNCSPISIARRLPKSVNCWRYFVKLYGLHFDKRKELPRGCSRSMGETTKYVPAKTLPFSLYITMSHTQNPGDDLKKPSKYYKIWGDNEALYTY